MDGADEVRQLLNSRTLKYLRALLKGITVVAWQWLEQCVQQGTWLPVRPYLLQVCVVRRGRGWGGLPFLRAMHHRATACAVGGRLSQVACCACPGKSNPAQPST